MRSFFVMLMAVGGLASIAQWLMYRTIFPCLASKWSILIFAVPVFAFSLINGYMNVLPLVLTRALGWITGLYLGFFYYSVLLCLLFVVGLLLGKIIGVPSLAPWIAKGGFAFILLLLIVGAWNATHHVYREETFTTAKQLERPVKIAFVADLHLGVLFGKSYSENLVAKINAAQPDIVLLGGDIIDNDLQFVKNEGSLEPLQNLQAPMGVYGVYGNHDVMRGTGEAEGKYLEKLNLKMVCNETVHIGDNIVLTGLDDFMRSHNSYEFAQAPGNKLALFMEHQPRSIERAAAKGYDLSFAGHTHAGQFYPNREITKRMYSLDYGSKFFGQMLATVTNGYSLWGIPLRIGPAPEIVIINVDNK